VIGQGEAVAERGETLQFLGAEIRKHRVRLQNNGKFGRFTHRNAFAEPIRNRRARG
jgi:hypothetical protein